MDGYQNMTPEERAQWLGRPENDPRPSREKLDPTFYANAARLYAAFDIVTDLGPPLTRWQRVKMWFGWKPPRRDGPVIGSKVVIRTPPPREKIDPQDGWLVG